MNRKLYLVVLGLFIALGVSAQSMTFRGSHTYRVAIISPMYLDSAFDHGTLKSELPNIMMAGLDFAHGAMLAFDTIQANGRKIEAHFFDSKSISRPTSWLIQNGRLDSMDLIIGSVRDPEFQQLAQFSQEHHIPFISATYPNTGGLQDHPYLIIINPTLESHIEAIHSYLVQKHSMDNIYLVKQPNDNRIADLFDQINRRTGSPLLNLKTTLLDTSVTTDFLKYRLDTTRPMVIIGATLNRDFAVKLAEACFPLAESNELSLIGMPNWDGFRQFFKQGNFEDFPIRYTTPHLDVRKSNFASFLNNKYFDKYKAKPSDMVYKGFEAAYYFTQILLNHGKFFMAYLNSPEYAPFHDFNFRPIYLPGKMAPDYFENKHLFIVQIFNGHIVRDW